MVRFVWFVLLALAHTATSATNVNNHEGSSAEDHSEEDISDEAVIEDTEETLVLTKSICTDGHRSSYMTSHCCQIYIDTDSATEYCVNSLKNIHGPGKEKLLAKYAKLSECVYRRKKYTKGSRALNIGHVKADAAKLHDPLAEKYMVDMYRDCGHQAQSSMDDLSEASKKSPTARQLFRSLRKPYFMFVHSCVRDYSKTHQCPHFRWGARTKEAFEKCIHFTEKCKKLLKGNGDQ